MQSRKHSARKYMIGLVIFTGLAVFSLPAEAEDLRPVIEVKRLGNAQIEPDNQYSENTRVRIRLLYPSHSPNAGQVMKGLPGKVTLSEYVTRIYDGKHGATRLPMKLPAAAGEWEIVVKSLARYIVPDQRYAPVPRIEVIYRDQVEMVNMPQWVDADDNGKMDWLEMRVNDLLARMRNSDVSEVRQVVRTLEAWRESYRVECGGVETDMRNVVRIAPSCISWEGENDHRLNNNQELTATILHEARHVWQKHKGMFSKAEIQSKTVSRKSGKADCKEPSGDCFTRYVVGEGRARFLEEDAEDFANRYKSLFP